MTNNLPVGTATSLQISSYESERREHQTGCNSMAALEWREVFEGMGHMVMEIARIALMYRYKSPLEIFKV